MFKHLIWSAIAHMQYVRLLLQNKLVLIGSQVDTRERAVVTIIGAKIKGYKILR